MPAGSVPLGSLATTCSLAARKRADGCRRCVSSCCVWVVLSRRESWLCVVSAPAQAEQADGRCGAMRNLPIRSVPHLVCRLSATQPNLASSRTLVLLLWAVAARLARALLLFFISRFVARFVSSVLPSVTVRAEQPNQAVPPSLDLEQSVVAVSFPQTFQRALPLSDGVPIFSTRSAVVIMMTCCAVLLEPVARQTVNAKDDDGVGSVVMA
ncbi:hypothetical protein V8C44DRAFT_339895 [Trichoderma aethiopicum]